MKRFLILCVVCFAMLSCSNKQSDFIAIYHFNVENTLGDSKAIFEPSGDVIWEIGDEIRFFLRVYNKTWDEMISGAGMTEGKFWEQEIRAKLVFDGAEWETYVYEEEDYSFKNGKKVDNIKLISKRPTGCVTFDYHYDNIPVIAVGWHNTIEFKEGLQIINVQVPNTLKIKE